MKKLLIYLGIIVGLFAAVFFVNQSTLKSQDDNVYGIPASKLNPLTVKQLKNPNYQNIILPDELTQRLQEKTSTFVYFFSPDCPHCIATTPHLVPLTKELGVDMKMYNVMEFKQGWKDFKLEGTPTLIFFKDGQIADRIEGGLLISDGKPTAESFETFKSFFNKYKDQ